MLDVNRLRVIDAVARHGSVTAAAKELHYAQPSVTHHLARLEAETGAQLLQRVGRGIRLTPPGSSWPTAPPRSSGGSMPPARSCRPTWG
jgi:DNA-binding transcriptional LysR family regulator